LQVVVKKRARSKQPDRIEKHAGAQLAAKPEAKPIDALAMVHVCRPLAP
jgi:hypothetical protein